MQLKAVINQKKFTKKTKNKINRKFCPSLKLGGDTMDLTERNL